MIDFLIATNSDPAGEMLFLIFVGIVALNIAAVLLYILFNILVVQLLFINDIGCEWGPGGLILYLLLWVFLFPVMLGIAILSGLVFLFLNTDTGEKVAEWWSRRRKEKYDKMIEEIHRNSDAQEDCGASWREEPKEEHRGVTP